MATQKVLALIGGLMIAAALIIGFVPVSSDGVNCGSAFNESSDPRVADLTTTMGGYGSGNAADSCDSLRSLMLVPVWVLLGVGGIVLVAAMVASSKAHSARWAEDQRRRSQPGTQRSN